MQIRSQTPALQPAARESGGWRYLLELVRGAETSRLMLFVTVFVLLYALPVEWPRFTGAVHQALALGRWYAREHVLLCLVPAFFIAGALSTLVRQEHVLRLLGPAAPRPLAYSVASVSGTLLAVCSCTVLPLFAGIYTLGAGLGPAAAFLYSGPAINVLAVILTGRVLGPQLGLARAVGAIAFSLVIGLSMQWLFRAEARRRPVTARTAQVEDEDRGPTLRQGVILLTLLVGILVFANWAGTGDAAGFSAQIHRWRWVLTGLLALALGAVLVPTYGVRPKVLLLAASPAALAAVFLPAHPQAAFSAGAGGLSVLLISGAAGEGGRRWLAASWDFAKQILPLLLAGVLAAGLLLGRPGAEGLIPSSWVEGMVGGESLAANLFASVAGALMYFATLTEIPILDGLIGAGMGRGPALALLLAGPALSLPNMLVIRSVLGVKKTMAFVGLVVVLSTVAGLLFGAWTS